MSWRPSNNRDYRPSSSYSSQRDSRAGASTITPTMRLIIIGAAALVVIVIGVIIAVNVAGSQGGAPSTPAAAQPTAVPTVASTASPVATTASAPVIVSARSTPTPAPTVGPEDAGSADTSGDAAAGMTLFNGMPNEALLAGAVTCSTCHLIDDSGVTMVGPNLTGVATRAETRVAVLSPAQYLRTSIMVPDSYVVEGFIPGTMTQTFEEALTPEQIEDLVAYLLTLK